MDGGNSGESLRDARLGVCLAALALMYVVFALAQYRRSQGADA